MNAVFLHIREDKSLKMLQFLAVAFLNLKDFKKFFHNVQ